MPVQAFFSPGGEFSRDRDHIGEFDPGGFRYFNEYTYVTSGAGFLIAVSCYANNKAAELFEIPKPIAAMYFRNGNPAQQMIMPIDFLESGHVERHWEDVLNPNLVPGRLTLLFGDRTDPVEQVE